MFWLFFIKLLFAYRFDGKPEDVLNPKKKQLDKITPVHFSDLFDIYNVTLSLDFLG